MNEANFHIHVYGPTTTLAESTTNRMSPIPTSFEAAMQRLETLVPQPLSEPDGSIAWAGSDHRIVGMIYDAAGHIQYLELRGYGTAYHWRTLIQSICGQANIDRFSIMLLPERQWKNFQSFANLLGT